MKQFLNIHVAVTAHLLFIVSAIIIGIVIADESVRDAREVLVAQASAQEKVMEELAHKTDGNDVDGVAAAILTDCPNRKRFELLLMDLGTLKKPELIEVQQLFESCGSFYAERKALMVSRLEREYAALTDIVAALTVLDASYTAKYPLRAWGELVALERERSSLLNEQVDIQHAIIIALMLGNTVGSSEVTASVVRATELAETLGVLDARSDTLRASLRN